MRFAVLALLITAGACSRNGPPAVRIAVFRGEDLAPLTAALGHFKMEGLDAEIHDLASSSKAMEALFGGSAEVVAGGYDHAVRLAAEGRRARCFMVLSVRSPLALVASPKSPQIRSVKDLKGATVAVSAFGSSGNFFVNLLLSRNGLTPNDVKLVATGGGHAVTVAWAEQGQVDAIVTLPPSLAVLRARHPDLAVLADGTSAEGSHAVFGVDAYPAIALMAKEEWLAANADIARRITRAQRRTFDWLTRHSAEDFQKALRGRAGSPEELDGLRATMTTSSRDGSMPAGGPEAIRDAIAVSAPAVRNVDLAQTYTPEYLP